MGQQVIIVGAGQAACSMAAKLRELDSDAKITIIGEESHLPYQRPPLSKKYATGEMDLDSLMLRPADWYEVNDIQCITGLRVESIDTNAKSILLSDGKSLNYDKLALTTGSRPRALPASIGGELDGVYVVRGIDHVDSFASEMVEGRSALVIGGGYIGLEAAAVLARKGLKVRVVEMSDRILQRVACSATSDFFRALHSGHEVEISENLGLARLIEKDGRVCGAEFSDGSSGEYDFVLVGIGVLANSELAEEAGIACDNGITVNGFGQTSNSDIYAAGDCAKFEYKSQFIRLESVQNAIDQAECAAKNIAGVETDYHPHPWFWSDQYDVKLQIAGLNLGYDQVVLRPGAREGTQSIWYFDQGKFISVDAMNDPRSFMVGKRLLEKGLPITPEQAGDVDLELKTLMK
ncbi:MAG: NAD(P)/FAD-dependent oxidoreductase [Rhizobiaceae bacterium]|nr:NAD(P)/FAD-dependent oxidoreductase [Rhizobiaceae bacterium]MBL4696768.1 NAD(P)/FAD-dependent oxidoreductase [Rhizobiaceae bacterium]